MTHELAANQLGCPVGTVRSRLAKARALLQRRVSRRGLTLSVPALAAVLESNARAAAIPVASRTALLQLASRFVSETAATSGGLGASAAVAAIMEGAWHVVRIKRPAIFAATMISLGALGIVIANRALVVGQTPPAPAPWPGQPIGTGRVRPHGRPIAAVRNLQTTTFATTYWVGDLMSANPPLASTPSNTPLPAEVVRSTPDMKPLICLITSTVAPETWRVLDENGDDATAQTLPNTSEGGRPVDSKRVGSITPFFLSVSLIVRCTAEIHEQVANLLKGLRDVVYARSQRYQLPSREIT